jgi:hypothetical protein
MSRTLNEILAALPEDQRQHVETRADELRQEIEAQWRALGIQSMTLRLRVWEMAPFLPAPKPITAIRVLTRHGLPLLQAKRAIEAALLADTTTTLPLVESFENLRTELADARFSAERVEDAS